MNKMKIMAEISKDRERIFETVQENRGTGSTNWLFNAALDNPNVIFVFGSRRVMKKEKERYDKLYEEFANPHAEKPLFFSLEDVHCIRGYNKPIVFDNSCLE
jgi:hypothetical protein